MPVKQFDAIIFDLDGVIINSEDLHAEAKRITLNRYGIDYPEGIFNEFKGKTDMAFWKYVSAELTIHKYTAEEMDASKRKTYFGIIHGMRLVDGAMDFLEHARKMFRQTAVVTSATKADLMAAEEKFGFLKWFDVVQMGEDTQNHKPHPDPYLMAIRKLNIKPAQAFVIEDSPNGVLSAKAAGCYVTGITTGFTEAELTTAGADLVVGSFAEIIINLK
ncbi:MAG TPA: HAD family phosphatase [Bacteroidales bacterium]|nr:HAD family phosphatase [Bacteroidales bacterium]